MIKLRQLTFLGLLALLFISCEPEFDKFKRPEWLSGKLYTQMKDSADLSLFTQCLELTEYDTIIDVSGSYTVFAPTNDAFQEYFQKNPTYNAVEEIPMEELTRLVKYHIVQNPWSKVQLRSLDVYGWIDTMDINNDKAKGFKRETLLLNQEMNVGVRRKGEREFQIVDTLASPLNRKVVTDSRKYAPIFYKEYFDIYDLNSSDYAFYFGRPFESSNDIYFANAKIVGDEIFAENGFIYRVDQVVEPLKNGYEILSSEENTGSYSDFLDLVNLFPDFNYNDELTMDQPGAEEGLKVDSLFDVTYPELLYSIHNERTRPPSGTFGLPNNVTIRYHYGLMAPTNEALAAFIAEYIDGPKQWGNFDRAPRNIKRMIVNTYMAPNPIYQTDLENRFYNGEMDLITVDEKDIIDKQFGSNASFFGLKKAIIPRAFSSITGPIYRQGGYSFIMNAIERSGLSSALKRQNQTYSFYVESDMELRQDSSLLFNPVTERFSLFQISGSTAQEFGVGLSDLRTLILNQVGVEQPNGVARKEFIKNMAGNYLIIDNETGVVQGTNLTTDGYEGSRTVELIPKKISTNADNGVTYDVEDWFSFTASNVYSKISTSYSAFHDLLVQADLALPNEYRYTFLSESEIYTIFIPTQEAIENYDFSLLPKEELQKLLQLHFIQGKMIFTDGNAPSGYYETTRKDEKSTEFSTFFTKIYVDTGYDILHIPAKDGTHFLTVEESPTANQIMARNIGESGAVFPVLSSTAVIHEIDRVLQFEELDTK
jgi:uncharacterized surface protein with fasciclin (FAS1) repeats